MPSPSSLFVIDAVKNQGSRVVLVPRLVRRQSQVRRSRMASRRGTAQWRRRIGGPEAERREPGGDQRQRGGRRSGRPGSGSSVPQCRCLVFGRMEPRRNRRIAMGLGGGWGYDWERIRKVTLGLGWPEEKFLYISTILAWVKIWFWANGARWAPAPILTLGRVQVHPQVNFQTRTRRVPNPPGTHPAGADCHP
jgi:hypothetical protein